MTITFRTTGPPVTVDDVAAFEATLPGPMPDDYRTFLLISNGGQPEANWWPPEVNDGDFGVQMFLGLGRHDVYSLPGTRVAFTDRVPAHLLVVAGDSFGNQLCLSLAEQDRGRVYFFDHELETEPEDGQDPDLLTLVADSFTEFLDTLEPEPTLEEMVRRTGVILS